MVEMLVVEFDQQKYGEFLSSKSANLRDEETLEK